MATSETLLCYGLNGFGHSAWIPAFAGMTGVGPTVTPPSPSVIYNPTMYKTTRHWAKYAWIACLAILFNAFVPVVSHALNFASPASAAKMEVCTAMGIEMLPMALPGEDGTQAPDKLLKSLTHCGYCATHAGSFGLPPPLPAVFAVIGGHDVYPTLYYAAPRRLATWSPAQSRAPPVAA